MNERTNDGARWLPIAGYEDLYEVSDAGQVWSAPRATTRGGLLRRNPNHLGYLYVTLTRCGVQRRLAVHRLVAAAFLGPCPEGQEVRHLDGNPPNCAAANLVYGTHSENMFDRRGHGTDHNANKTHCPQGHEYIPENTEVRVYAGTPRRFCLACRKIAHRKTYERQREQGLTAWVPNEALSPEQLARRREKAVERQKRYRERLEASGETCSLDGCTRPLRLQGLCAVCYNRQQRHARKARQQASDMPD
jgi:hypothetical protein